MRAENTEKYKCKKYVKAFPQRETKLLPIHSLRVT